MPITIGTVPIQTSINNPPMVFVPSKYAPSPNTMVTLDTLPDGEMIESDIDTFKPCYPYYQFQN